MRPALFCERIVPPERRPVKRFFCIFSGFAYNFCRKCQQYPRTAKGKEARAVKDGKNKQNERGSDRGAAQEQNGKTEQ